MSGCLAAARAPMTWGDDALTVVPGTLDEAGLERRLAEADAAVIMKLGRNFAKVRRALTRPAWSSARSMSSAARWRARR